MSKKLEQLKKQRQMLDQEIEKVEKDQKIKSLRQLSTIKTSDKEKAFDELYDLATEYVNKRINEGSVSVEDYPNWFKEAVLQQCFGPKIFDYLNQFKN